LLITALSLLSACFSSALRDLFLSHSL
jgi:hypothetical protein